MSNRRPLGVRLPPRILLVSYRFNPIDPMDGAVRHRPCAPIGALWNPNGPLFVLRVPLIVILKRNSVPTEPIDSIEEVKKGDPERPPSIAYFLSTSMSKPVNFMEQVAVTGVVSLSVTLTENPLRFTGKQSLMVYLIDGFLWLVRIVTVMSLY